MELRPVSGESVGCLTDHMALVASHPRGAKVSGFNMSLDGCIIAGFIATL